jgi:phosphate transport system substrate-binding protein
MNFDLRFQQGANELDSRAQEDIKRFAAYVAGGQIDKRRIALLGFADNVGARATNMGLAQSRAETVGIELEKLGVSPGIIRSYGDAMPVGANAEEQGRIRNRRVEVWLCAPPACPLVDLVSQASTGTREIPAGVRLGPPRPAVAGEEPPKG